MSQESVGVQRMQHLHTERREDMCMLCNILYTGLITGNEQPSLEGLLVHIMCECTPVGHGCVCVWVFVCE